MRTKFLQIRPRIQLSKEPILFFGKYDTEYITNNKEKLEEVCNKKCNCDTIVDWYNKVCNGNETSADAIKHEASILKLTHEIIFGEEVSLTAEEYYSDVLDNMKDNIR
jgi:hypothetical protein